ncbi:hypothetical protein KCTC52924_03885 [Arenibacter antarcticus]|uniref:Uncharacterized protein n=1 Tax=Arenibacter antarcticus TaxID=2040469 RepID=A0ABW5VD62_9FLAO|nr:hypothetical protein [Arenibacter sp. H213]MCM4168319.1 hypothetical protein [Arenibacter sp. H213]
MIEPIYFLNDRLFWFIMGGLILLWGVFIWKEGALFPKGRFFVRMLVATLALLALALIALKPMIPSKYNPMVGVVLTPGYQVQLLDSLRKTHDNLKVLNYDDGVDISDFLSLLHPVYILGRGIAPFNFWQYKKRSSTYLGGTLSSGVVRLNYDQEGTEGSKLIVKGVYNKPQSGNVLVLTDPAGTGLDSVAMSNYINQEFSLISDRKVQGQFLFSLVEKDSMGIIVGTEPLPQIIRKKKIFKVLILNGFPTFETKYLKNFLAEAGHELVVRSQMTKGKFKFEYFNTEKIVVNQLSHTLLKAFDLLIMDSETYLGLPKTTLEVLKVSVLDNGLGIFVQPNETLYTSQGNLLDFNFIKDNIKEMDWEKDSKTKMSKYPFHIHDEMRVEPIHKSHNTLLTAYKRLGKGRVGTSVMHGTFSLLLVGDSRGYREFWTTVIEAIGKRHIPGADWKVENFPVFVNEPLNFKLNNFTADSVVRSSDGYSVPLMQHVEVKNLWSGTTFPRQTGWNSLQLEIDTTTNNAFYVMDTLSWSSLRGYDLIQENKRFFNSKKDAAKIPSQYQLMNPLWFYSIFILGIGYLWLAPKLTKEE